MAANWTDIEAALDATGTPWKRGQRETGHWIINAPSLKQWTSTQRDSLVTAIEAIGLSITQRLVDSRWNEKQAHPLRQFRAYSA